MFTKRILAALIIILIIGTVILYFFYKHSNNSKPRISLNGHTIFLKIADTEEKRIQGLSGRAKLGDNEGMLFIFPYKSPQSFWMKNMHFPLDIIWIDGNKIVGISANLLPEGETPSRIYSSPQKVDKVLEINSGLATKWGLKVGDRAEMTNTN